MPDLHSRLQSMAVDFAHAVLGAIQSAPLDELLEGGGPPVRARPARPPGLPTAPAVPHARAGRLQRRSPEQISKLLEQVVALIKKSPEGLRAEQIRQQLGLEAKEIPRILKEGLTTKVLRTKGQKRATTYFAK